MAMPTTETTSAGAGAPDAIRTGVAWLDEIRESAWRAYAEMPLPDRATHLWRYTDPKLFAPPLDAPFARVNGSGSASARDAGAAGVVIRPLVDAARESADLIAGLLGGLIPRDFGKPEALNLALWSRGSWIDIPKGARVAEPIRLPAGGGPAGPHLVRNLIRVGEDAEVTLIEESSEEGNSGDRLVIETTEIWAGPSARITYIPLQDYGGKTIAHRTARIRLDRGAKVLTVIPSFGAGSYKADLGVVLDGEGAESRMIGLCFGDGRRRADHHTVHDHRAPRTLSDIDFRVVLVDKARSTYTGLIRIVEEAPYCEAFQENRNLLLSGDCRAESIPELEILTDEVRCKHGATMGPIDGDQLFYLRSRGLSEAEATRMVVRGFLEATLSNLPEGLREAMVAEIEPRLNRIGAP